MTIIDTPFHVTFTNQTEKPVYACTGNCKKSWWSWDLEKRDKNTCPQCHGGLTEAVEMVHFKVLRKANRVLRTSDFKDFISLPSEQKKEIKEMISKKWHMDHMSFVKPKFQEKALREWCQQAK